MTEEQKAKLASLIAEQKATQKEFNVTVAKMLRVVLELLEPEPYVSIERAAQRAKDRAELPAALSSLIKMLEK